MSMNASQLRYNSWYDYAHGTLNKSVKDSEIYAEKRVKEYEKEEIEKMAKILDGGEK